MTYELTPYNSGWSLQDENLILKLDVFISIPNSNEYRKT
jgi:hypothetical protein